MKLRSHAARGLSGAAAAALVAWFTLPLLALVVATSARDLRAALHSTLFVPAVLLSLQTTLVSLAFTLLLGTPLAWWLARSRSRLVPYVELLVELPIVIPPAVVGVGLLQLFGVRGWFGPALASLGLSVSFSTSAVVMAQLTVSAPFFVQAAARALARLDPDLLIVSRSLGASPAVTFFRVALPVALPGLVAGASLAWARALGEFGATLLFAGNLTGRTQTLPLAIYSALERDVRLAVVFALTLAALGTLLLFALRLLPRLLAARIRAEVPAVRGAAR